MQITNEHNEDCPCDFCAIARAEFQQWCDETEERWAKAEREGRVAAATAPSGLLEEYLPAVKR